MQFLNLLIVAALSLVTGDRVFFPKSSRVAVNWNQVDAPLDPNHRVNLRVALHPKDAATLQKTLINLSTPGSPVFRQWLKKDQITDIVGRSDADIAKINNYLSTQNLKVNSINPHRDWVFIDATVAQVEKVFQCKLAIFENKKTGGTRIVSTNGYSIPEEISDIVRMVAGLNTFSGSHWSAVDSRADTAVAAQVTPDTIYTNYQAPKTGSHGSKKGSQAVVEFGKAANFNDADLQTFFTDYQPSLVGETCGMSYGTNNGNAKPSVEANLDVQYIMAAGVFVNTTGYKMTEGGNIEDQMLDYAILVNSQTQPPLVHSISYGEYGGSYDNTTDHQFDYELQKMGASGITVLLASGDNGVGCNTAGTSLEFDFPDCPHITMVGATYIDSATKQEIGATLSSGGFSENFMMPDWQAAAVTAYLNSGVKLPSQYYQSAGRAYPDIAAYGQNVQVVASGKSEAVSGTSCSAPIFAGIIAAINDVLLSSGKSSMGFINPWVYAHPEVFTDITSGSNPYQKCDGFLATAGWDPVTGMGTPLYNKMLSAAQSGR